VENPARGKAVRLGLDATLPPDLQEAFAEAYRGLQGGGAAPPDVTVRSSATAEDLPDAGFAGASTASRSTPTRC
jgi:pyruvate, water dikinase